MNGFFYRPEITTTRWISRILWFYFIVFIFQQITQIWFNCGVLDAVFCLQPRSCTNLQIWRFFTYSFLHSDFWHIFFNLLLFYSSSRLLLQGELTVKQLLTLYSFGIILKKVITAANIAAFVPSLNNVLLFTICFILEES